MEWIWFPAVHNFPNFIKIVYLLFGFKTFAQFLSINWYTVHLQSFHYLKNKRPTWCHLLFYFTSYVLNMFRTLIYPSSGAWDYSVELPHWSYCAWFDVCWSFGVVGLIWYPCWRLKHRPVMLQPATRISLQPNHTETPTHIEPRTVRPMW